MPATVEAFTDSAGAPPVRGFLHRPARPGGDGLVLTHGAGGDSRSPLLVALAEAFSGLGWSVLRCDLPFRQARPHGPPRGTDATDREGLRRALEVLRKFVPGRVALGGQSYGGRQATLLASEQPKLADGLLILSYPLHPPGKPGQLRTGHLPKLETAALFVSGSADPFGSPDELRSALQLVAGRKSLVIMEGVGHDLGFGRRARGGRPDLPAQIAAAFQKLLDAKPSR